MGTANYVFFPNYTSLTIQSNFTQSCFTAKTFKLKIISLTWGKRNALFLGILPKPSESCPTSQLISQEIFEHQECLEHPLLKVTWSLFSLVSKTLHLCYKIEYLYFRTEEKNF